LIHVFITLDSEGILSKVIADGHSEYEKKGRNIVCAAATVLLRTAARQLEGITDVKLKGEAETPGSLNFVIEWYSENRRAYLKGITDFLARGIDDLSVEFPSECSLTIHRI
jgi:uncharacterized protein